MFKIGDWIYAGVSYGQIDSIERDIYRVRLLDNRIVYLPHSTIIKVVKVAYEDVIKFKLEN